MKKTVVLLLVVIVLIAMLPAAVQGAAGYRLVAGQNQIVGWVFVENDADNLHVTYETRYGLGFCLLETHLHAADTWQAIPQNNGGNPIPGQFDYSGEHNCERFAHYTIPLGDWEAGDMIALAAHAVIGNYRDPAWEETGWGAVCGDLSQNQFPGANWAVYAPYPVK